MRRIPSSIQRLLVVVPLTVLPCLGCGGALSVEDVPLDTEMNTGWINIQMADSPCYCDEVSLFGEAFVSDDWYRCCSGEGSDSGVTVTWRNETTDVGGTASHSVRICYVFGTPYPCEHRWSARVPIVLGSNLITVRARDPSGNQGTASVTIDKPGHAYDLTGTVTDTQGRPVESEATGACVKLVAEGSGPFRHVRDGAFSFSCVKDGTYAVVPYSTKPGITFDPPEQTVTVSGADVGGVHFTCKVYYVSGTIRGCRFGETEGRIRVDFRGDDSAYTAFVATGSTVYQTGLPPGRYYVIPSKPGLVFTPESRFISVSDEDVDAVSFCFDYAN